MHTPARRPTPLAASAPLALAATLFLAGCGPNLFERAGNFGSPGCFGIIVVILDIIALVELIGSSKSVGNKVGWALVVIFFPVLGCVLYYFFGRS